MSAHVDTVQPSAGAVPAAYLGLLTRRWSRDMPALLRQSRFYVLLHVAHDRADALGTVRALDGGDVVQELARACCLPLASAVHYLAAAVASGVLTERAPGLYALAPAAVPTGRRPSTT
ncbi:hypothetical protein ABZX90_08450 [Streptomyces sp. NPDC002935]|uniref:hypothetical protein n=1 Tax=Streptomyces sp. NPDC002935 TaxID=3154545 RepID=UPI0033B1EAC7